jgi:hypothetical protein
MTWDETETFTKRTVLHFLKQIVRAEERREQCKELQEIARGLPFFVSCNFILILRNTFKIDISI